MKPSKILRPSSRLVPGRELGYWPWTFQVPLKCNKRQDPSLVLSWRDETDHKYWGPFTSKDRASQCSKTHITMQMKICNTHGRRLFSSPDLWIKLPHCLWYAIKDDNPQARTFFKEPCVTLDLLKFSWTTFHFSEQVLWEPAWLNVKGVQKAITFPPKWYQFIFLHVCAACQPSDWWAQHL